MAERKDAYWLFKYLWVLVIVPKAICSILVFGYGLFLFTRLKRIKIDNFLKMIFAFLAVYVLSVFVRVFAYQSLDSVPATINTFSMWFFGIIFYSYILQNNIDYKKIGRYCFYNMNILLLLSIMFLLKDHLHVFEHFSILGNKLYNEPSWTNEGMKYRLFAFMEYPTNVATFYCINAGASLDYVFEKYESMIVRICYSVIIALPVYLSDTRSGIIATLIVIMAVIFFSIDNVNYRRIFAVLGILIVIPIVILLFGNIEASFISMLDSRAGSSSTRIRLYITTINKVLSESPLIGMGIKYPNPYVFGLPYGSHSTYIGVIYRTGIIGMVIFIAMFWQIAKKSILTFINNEKNRFLGVVMLAYFVAIVFLDIDASAWVLAMFFVNVGLILRLQTRRVHINNPQ